MNKRKVHCLVVDSGAFIKNAPIHEFGEKIFTVSGAVNEVKDRATRQRLQFLPYELKCREPSREALKYATEFSKKTGDYPSLSAVDIQIIALTFELEKELVGTDHLNREPTPTKISCQMVKPPTSLIGFYHPDEKNDQETYNSDSGEDSDPIHAQNTCGREFSNANHKDLYVEENACDVDGFSTTLQNHLLKGESKPCSKVYEPGDPPMETHFAAIESESETSNFKELNRDDTENEKSSENCDVESCSNLKEECLFYETKNHIDSEKFVTRPEQSGPLPNEISFIGAGNTTNNYIFDENAQNESSFINSEDSNQEGTDSPCEGNWITPDNINSVKEKMGVLSLNSCDTSISVSCITTDYAIQNVLLQMGLKILSVDGMLIKHTKCFILRCFACYTTTSNMTKKFCPECGNMTLKKVIVTVDEDGQKIIYINYKRPINIRGMKYSLPMPRGGKHAVNPVLCEDQPIPQNRPSKAALRKVNALDPDYVALNSPFAPNDLNSRAASLGIVGRQVGRNLYRNPNVCSRRRRRKKRN